MDWQAWLTVAVVAAMFVAMVRGLMDPAVAIVSAVVVLMIAGVIDERQAFAGFANPAPITVAALYVLARAVEDTGALRPLVRAALSSGAGQRGGLLRLCFPSAAASAVLNNTPIVAMLISPVSEWAESRGISPSRFLMPLSFAVILGGVVTTIGTSTNLVVSGLLQQSGAEPFGMFEISHVGLPMALCGIVLVAIMAPLVLPDRQSPRRGLAAARDFVVRMIVEPGGPLAGRNVEAVGLRHLEGVFLVEIERDGEPIAPVAPTTVLHDGDHLLFVGEARVVADLRSTFCIWPRNVCPASSRPRAPTSRSSTAGTTGWWRPSSARARRCSAAPPRRSASAPATTRPSWASTARASRWWRSSAR